MRPETRYSYTSLQAFFKNTSGSIVASGEPVSKLTKVSECQTLATCANAADGDYSDSYRNSSGLTRSPRLPQARNFQL